MRLLIVEADASLRALLTSRLEAECFAVDATESGENGSYLARTNDYDMVILADDTSSKSGREVCAEIRQQGKTMPIIMLTSHTDVATRVEFFRLGVDDCLSKPFSFDELLVRVRSILRRPKHLEPTVYTIDDLMLDPQGHVAQRGGKSIQLTRKELMLLEYLMQHKGLVVTRGMLIEHVWDMHLDPLSNTIDTHILSLRKKLNVGNKHKLIYTVPGRGYKMEAR